MLKILSILFLVIFVIIAFFVNILRYLVRTIFRRPTKNNGQTSNPYDRTSNRAYKAHTNQRKNQTNTTSQPKIIGKEEGEYVDFEEVE